MICPKRETRSLQKGTTMIKRPLRNLTAASILAGATHGAIAQTPMPQTPSTKAADDSETGPRRAAFLQGLQELGRSEGRNLRIDYRWGVGDTRPRDGCADAQLHVRRQLGRWRRVRRWPSRLCTAGRWRHGSRARELDQVTGFDLERSFASRHRTHYVAFRNADQLFSLASIFSIVAIVPAWSPLVRSTSSRKPSCSSRMIRPSCSNSS